MKRSNIIIFILFVFVIGAFNRCAKSENFFAYGSDKVNKKIIPGTWDIVELEVWIFDDGQTHSVLQYFTFNDVGNIEFIEGGECHFNLNGGSLDLTYLTLYSTDTWKWNYLSGSFDFNEYFHGNVISMDKKHMTIHMPWSLNLYTTDRVIIGKSVEFRFKLKKQ